MPEVYSCVEDCIPILTLQLQLSYKEILSFLLAAIFKSRLLKMAATVMTVEFYTSHHNSSLEENSEPFLLNSLDRYKN